MEERGGMDVPPPYKAIRPVRAKLCFSGPTLSTACCAMTSPVAKSTCSRANIESGSVFAKLEIREMDVVVLMDDS